MNNINNYEYDNKKVRVLNLNGTIWFIGIDAARLLGYKNESKALITHVPDKHRKILKSQNGTLEGLPNRGLIGITEAGFFRLVLKSELPEADEIVEWITSEVLPTIRKTGRYELTDKLFKNMALLPNTPYREKINQKMLTEGKDENDIEIRCFNVKLSEALKNLLIKVGHGGSVPYVRRKLGEAIRRMSQEEYDKLNGVTNSSNRRDYGDSDEWTVTQILDKMMFKMINDTPHLDKTTLHKYVKEVCKRGLGIWALIITDEKLYKHITTNQSSLFDYEKRTVKKLELEV